MWVIVINRSNSYFQGKIASRRICPLILSGTELFVAIFNHDVKKARIWRGVKQRIFTIFAQGACFFIWWEGMTLRKALAEPYMFLSVLHFGVNWHG